MRTISKQLFGFSVNESGIIVNKQSFFYEILVMHFVFFSMSIFFLFSFLFPFFLCIRKIQKKFSLVYFFMICIPDSEGVPLSYEILSIYHQFERITVQHPFLRMSFERNIGPRIAKL